MDTQQIEEIESQAESLLAAVFGSADAAPLPVDVNRVADACGLSIRQGQFHEPALVGAFDRSRNVIYVSDSDPFVRQAFTVGHEIGHAKLHEDKPFDVFHRRELTTLAESRGLEQEANWFAASLLMPRGLVYRYWDLLGGNVSQMASVFGVSAAAMGFRLRNLGKIRANGG